ncbi:MAG: ABC transporter ATP-binding protein [Chloroflexota bacterium]
MPQQTTGAAAKGKPAGPGMTGRGPGGGRARSGPDGEQSRRGAKGPGSKLSGPAWPILRRLLCTMRPHAGVLAGVLVAALATTAIELAPAWIIRLSVDRYILGGEPERIWWAAGGLLALSVVQGAVDFARLFLAAKTGQRIVFDLRNGVFEHLTQLSFSFYDRARTGDLMSRVTADTDVLSNFFGRAAVIVLTNLLTLIGILVVLITWDWRLGLLYVCFLPLIVHGQWVYARRVRPAMARIRRSLSALTSGLQESLAGILVIKLFGRERFEQKRIDRQSTAYREASIESARITSLWMPYANVVMGAATALVIWFGGAGVIGRFLTLGTLIGFTSYIQMLLRPIRQTGMMLNVVMRSLVAAERVFDVLDREPDIQDAPDAYPLPPVEGYVRYDGVTFAYDGGPEGAEALRDVDLEAAPGEMVALVGPSGAGKTTLVHLLPRFYDAQEGRITVDGHDIREVTVVSLRDAIGIALQSVFLFDASVGENIAYGNPGATQDQIEWAARTVQMHDFIRSLPLGYGTPVGERGVRLSGGQKQRIALARVLLTDPRILILDEPTSSVDAETERRMQEALTEVRAGRTTFVIAHRLWTVQQADQILVLRDGRIVERARGTQERSAHETLLAADGFYRQLYDLQFQAETLQATSPVMSPEIERRRR